jgi:peptidoglycan DL-endopeptidase CwlO
MCAYAGGTINAFTTESSSAGLQSYTLVASGWYDSDDSSSSLTYAWSYTASTTASSSSSATATPLTSTAATEYGTVTVPLPSGEVTVRCSICDSSSVCTATEISLTVPALSSTQTADLATAAKAAAATAAAAAASSSTAAAPVDAAAAAVTLHDIVGYAAALTTAAQVSSDKSSEEHSNYASLVAAGELAINLSAIMALLLLVSVQPQYCALISATGFTS